jgi:hypothetical protein
MVLVTRTDGLIDPEVGEGKLRKLLLRLRWPLLLLTLALFVLAAVIINRLILQAAPPQPIAFDHSLHDQAGIECLYCHPSAMRSDIAGIPSVQKCMGCHQNIATDRPEVMLLAQYWEDQEPIPWNPVNEPLEFVFFSHQPHLSSGVSCETCHGNVAGMTVAEPAIRMDMGWCLNCHLDQPEEKVARLTDCLACHK